MVLSLGQRLIGSRIVAGISVRAEAATQLGVSRVTLLRYESNAIRPDPVLLARAANLYGTSPEFLLEGVIKSERDWLAARTVALLSKVHDTDEIDLELAARLRLVRLERGYASGAKAAATMNFAQATYLSHENASRRIPTERAALYALQFRVRPEFLLLGKGAIFAAAEDPVSTWSPQQPSLETTGDEPSWRWLRKRADDNGLICPILMEKGGELEIASEAPISIPAMYLRKKLPSRPLYGILRPDGRIWIVNPASSFGEVVELTGIGTRLSMSEVDSPPSDILKEKMPPTDRIILGVFVGEIAFNAFSDS